MLHSWFPVLPSPLQSVHCAASLECMLTNSVLPDNAGETAQVRAAFGPSCGICVGAVNCLDGVGALCITRPVLVSLLVPLFVLLLGFWLQAQELLKQLARRHFFKFVQEVTVNSGSTWRDRLPTAEEIIGYQSTSATGVRGAITCILDSKIWLFCDPLLPLCSRRRQAATKRPLASLAACMCPDTQTICCDSTP